MSDHHDDWFQHSADEPEHMVSHGDTNSLVIIAFLFLTIVTVAVTIVLIKQYFVVRVAAIKGEVQEVRADHTVARGAIEAKAAWANTLDPDDGLPQWINQAEGTVSLPLDIAMQQVIDEYGGR